MPSKLHLFVLLLWLSPSLLLAQTTSPTPTTDAPLITKQPEPEPEPVEDWTALPLAKSGVEPDLFNAVLLSKIEEPTYTRELVHMQWRKDDSLEVTIVLPKGVTKPPVILYLYDYTSDTDRFRNDGWCKRATAGGFAAVGFVSALSGQRFHLPRPMNQWFVSQMQEALGTSTHDVQMVLNYLAARDEVDARRVGMFGQGSGGAIAILAAAVDPRITALDLLNPWGDWPDWLKGSRQIPEAERATYLTPKFLTSIAMMDPVNYLPTLKVDALRIQQVLDEPVTPHAAKDKIAAAAPKPTDVVRYPNTVAHEKAWRAQGLAGWLHTQLQTKPSPQNVATR